MIRGLFEYLYRADGLTLVPHIPPGITRLEQDFPIRFGRKRLYLATVGAGPVTAVTINGQPWTRFDAQTVDLPYDDMPDEADDRDRAWARPPRRLHAAEADPDGLAAGAAARTPPPGAPSCFRSSRRTNCRCGSERTATATAGSSARWPGPACSAVR